MSLMPDERPSPNQMLLAAAWLRKNDVDDPEGRACQKAADWLEDKAQTAKVRIRKRGAKEDAP